MKGGKMYIPFQRDDLKIVNGRSSAEQYFMYPNSRVLFMDSNCDRFYIKETDASGMAKISAAHSVQLMVSSMKVLSTQQLSILILIQSLQLLKKLNFNSKLLTRQLKSNSYNSMQLCAA